MRKEYQLQLYKELFPQDTTITEDDLEMITMDNVLTIHPYNDLGLLARGKLIILAEAQSTWSVNIIFRLADYYFDSAMSYLKIRKADLHSSVKVDVPDVEAFVIYTGKKKVETEILSLNQEFFGGDSGDIGHQIIGYTVGIVPQQTGFMRTNGIEIWLPLISVRPGAEKTYCFMMITHLFPCRFEKM